MKHEIRVSNIQIERRDDGEIGAIQGYAAVFNKDSEDMGFVERIKPGAFKGALKDSDVRALKNHDANLIFGRTGVNLELKEDSKGLFMRATRPNPLTDTWRSVAQDIEAGLITQQSFAFTVAREEWDKDYRNRTILEVDRLYDVSAVTYAAYPDTTVALRSREKAMEKRSADEKQIIVNDGDVIFHFMDIDSFKRVLDKMMSMAIGEMKKFRSGIVANNEPPESENNDAESRQDAIANNGENESDPTDENSTDESIESVANNENRSDENHNGRYSKLHSTLNAKGFI